MNQICECSNQYKLISYSWTMNSIKYKFKCIACGHILEIEEADKDLNETLKTLFTSNINF